MGDAKEKLLAALQEVAPGHYETRRVIEFVRRYGRSATDLEPSAADWKSGEFAICEVPVSAESRYLDRGAIAVYREYEAHGADVPFPVRCFYFATLLSSFGLGLVGLHILYSMMREQSFWLQGGVGETPPFYKLRADLDADMFVANILNERTGGDLSSFAQDQQPFRRLEDANTPAALFLRKLTDQATMREKAAREKLVARLLRRLRMPQDVLRGLYEAEQDRPATAPAAAR